MRTVGRTLLLTGILAGVTTSVVVSFHFLAWNHFIDRQLNQNSAAATITAVILAVTLWIILFVLVRTRDIGKELKLVRQVREALEDVTISLSAIDSYLKHRIADPHYGKSLIRHRFELMNEGMPGAQGDLPAFVASSQSGLDAANSEASYGPVRALVWALPALGFLGTASAMANAVSGLGNTVARTNSYTDLRSFLVQDVIPPLANAFGVTLIALASAVVCYVALTLAHTHEQRLLVETDSVTLETLAACSPAIGPDGSSASATGSIDALTKQLEQLNAFLSDAGLGRLASLLEEIRKSVGQDLIITRARSG